MLEKLTTKNELVLPRKAIEALVGVPDFEIEVAGDHLVLTSAPLGGSSAVSRKLAEIGVYEVAVADAVAWARH